MARWQRHVFQLSHIPCTHQHSAIGWVGAKRVNDTRQLVNVSGDKGAFFVNFSFKQVTTIAAEDNPGVFQAAPLLSVDRPEVIVLIGPCVPDFDAMLFQEADIASAFEIPLQLNQKRFEVGFFAGNKWH